MTGYDQCDAFTLLLQGAMEEIERCRFKNSFRPYDIIVMCEKFAIAGVRREDEFGAEFFDLAVEISREKLQGQAKLQQRQIHPKASQPYGQL